MNSLYWLVGWLVSSLLHINQCRLISRSKLVSSILIKPTYSVNSVRFYSKAPEEDTRTDTEKITEKFDIPRIIDLADEQYGMTKYLKQAQKSIKAREDALPPRPDSRYKGEFKMLSSIIIERFPTLMPLPTEYEQRWLDAKDRLNEIVTRPPMKMSAMIEDLPEFKSKPGEEDEDALEEDFDRFVAEPRETEADLKNDRKSLKRALDKSLYLIIKRRDGQWQFPSTSWIKGESIKNAAERALRDTTGSDWTYWIPSQAPCGVYKEYLDVEDQDQLKAEGIKNFFFRSHYFNGELKFSEKIVKDHLWVTKSEMKEYFSEDYMEQCHKLIFDDCFYNYI
ncbi:hypothetical protein PPL_12546 [Heterostelium album PN500]|uniref:Large ribosomal subunit protein mL46 n=1 Tax=Heterostelium pallidum (strain ATCC 26659 / Pp 5 / PN500) TaxID=670386 RepID=D3BMX3_HETP5|nr:hypothetical protein PPL_12546 [Heterostelium album PN500]EFA77335.1 hypothetical protein PPL_12546 [Heterostelium album PN500]|eukprot:XP_020429464.1 hypothetical protein PPL_12546 [Heterostelium album PN500]